MATSQEFMRQESFGVFKLHLFSSLTSDSSSIWCSCQLLSTLSVPTFASSCGSAWKGPESTVCAHTTVVCAVVDRAVQLKLYRKGTPRRKLTPLVGDEPPATADSVLNISFLVRTPYAYHPLSLEYRGAFRLNKKLLSLTRSFYLSLVHNIVSSNCAFVVFQNLDHSHVLLPPCLTETPLDLQMAPLLGRLKLSPATCSPAKSLS